jgi:RNA polymerase sigma-70 factor (ECF subfamily)
MSRMGGRGGRVTGPAHEADSDEAAGRPPAAASSFEEFFRERHIRLVRAMYLMTGDVAEAEELAQEAFLKVWERWDRVRILENAEGYLFRTAMNAFRSRRRRAVTAARRLVGRAPRDPFVDVEERDAVARALGRLTPRQRAALVLTHMLEYPAEEAGRILGVKAVTVRVLASQGRAVLRGALEARDD